MPLPVPERLHLSHPGRRHRALELSTGARRARDRAGNEEEKQEH